MPDKKVKRANQKVRVGGKPLPSDVTSPLGIELYDVFALQEHALDSSLREFATSVRVAETMAKVRKLRSLAEHLTIDVEREGGWAALALRLAEEFVPGFKTVEEESRESASNPVGRPKGTGLDSRQLADAIDTLRAAKPRMSVKNATAILAGKPEWRGTTESIAKRAASLESRFY